MVQDRKVIPIFLVFNLNTFFGFELIRFFFFQYELLFCIQDLEDSVSYAYVKVKFFTVVHVMHLTSIFSFQPIVVTMMMNS